MRGLIGFAIASGALYGCAPKEAPHRESAIASAAVTRNDTAMPPDTLLRVLEWTWLPGADDSLSAFLRLVEDARGRTFVRLEQVVDSNVRSFSASGPEPSRVLTYMALPPHAPADQLSLDGCRVVDADSTRAKPGGRLPDGKSEVAAVTESDDGSGGRLAVRRAWRANLAAVRITEVPATSVACWGEDTGGT